MRFIHYGQRKLIWLLHARPAIVGWPQRSPASKEHSRFVSAFLLQSHLLPIYFFFVNEHIHQVGFCSFINFSSVQFSSEERRKKKEERRKKKEERRKKKEERRKKKEERRKKKEERRKKKEERRKRKRKEE